jgi:hypothetical protein
VLWAIAGCEGIALAVEIPGTSEETGLRPSRMPSNGRNARSFLESVRMAMLHPG